MLEEPPLFHPKFWVNRHGLNIVLPDGRIHLVPPRTLRVKPDEVISDVLISVMWQVNVNDDSYTAVHDLQICYKQRELDDVRRDNMVLHLHLASYQEKRVARSHWQRHRSRARSSGNSLAGPR